MSLLKISSKHHSVNQIYSEQLFSFKTHIGSSLNERNSQLDEFLTGVNSNNDTVFDLIKSTVLLRRSLNFLRCLHTSKESKQILFVGTSNKTKFITKHLAKLLGHPYVAGRWTKGLLTNWENLSSSIKLYNLFLKKLTLSKKRKYNLESSLEGLRGLSSLPAVIVLLDTHSDSEVISEAKRLGIPVVALVDNKRLSLDYIDYPIILNTISPFSIFFLSSLIANCLEESQPMKG